jgi:NADH-quinone oxidoreductase subunit N
MGTMHILPEIMLTVGGVLVMVVESFLRRESSRFPVALLACIAALAAMGASVWQLHAAPADAYWGSIHTDGFSSFFHVLLSGILLCSLLLSADYFKGRAYRGELYALMLFGTTGMMFMTSAASLLLVFIGLEISSISSYVMTGYRRDSATGPEAALKYFLLGSFATAFFLYGVALAFGATGSDNIAIIGSLLALNPSSLAPVALALMLIGLGLKVSAAPFHVWTPDVYEGAPSPVTAFMSTGPKAAAFAVLLRVLLVSFPTLHVKWSVIVWVLAALSMTIGNLGALMQTSIKRMLAYSSIAHAGYILVAVAAGTAEGTAAAAFYLVSYAAMNLGAFAVLSYAARYEERAVSLSDFAGLARRSPFVAATFTLFLLSLIGIPFTGGFFGKFYVFTSALHSGLVWLTVIGLLNSGVGAYYYLRAIATMYMDAPEAGTMLELKPMQFGTATVLVITAATTLFLGIVPGHVLEAAQRGLMANAGGSYVVAVPAISGPGRTGGSAFGANGEGGR